MCVCGGFNQLRIFEVCGFNEREKVRLKTADKLGLVSDRGLYEAYDEEVGEGLSWCFCRL